MQNKIDEVVVEWDTAKNKSNLAKHGISFDIASLVFADPHRIEYYDRLHSEKEDRYITIGLVNDLIAVVYTERQKAVRIISARRAAKAEKEIYYGTNH